MSEKELDLKQLIWCLLFSVQTVATNVLVGTVLVYASLLHPFYNLIELYLEMNWQSVVIKVPNIMGSDTKGVVPRSWEAPPKMQKKAVCPH